MFCIGIVLYNRSNCEIFLSHCTKFYLTIGCLSFCEDHGHSLLAIVLGVRNSQGSLNRFMLSFLVDDEIL